MELSEIFFNRWERLRSGWRVLLFIVINYVLAAILFVAAMVALQLLLKTGGSVPAFLKGFWGWIIQSTVLLAAATSAGLVCAKLLEGLPPRSLGWTIHAGWWMDWLKGS